MNYYCYNGEAQTTHEFNNKTRIYKRSRQTINKEKDKWIGLMFCPWCEKEIWIVS